MRYIVWGRRRNDKKRYQISITEGYFISSMALSEAKRTARKNCLEYEYVWVTTEDDLDDVVFDIGEQKVGSK